MATYSWRKVGDDFGVSVWDGPDLLTGQTVTVTAKSGRTSEVKLGKRLMHDRKLQVYEIDRQTSLEDPPAQAPTPLPTPEEVPAGRYAIQESAGQGRGRKWQLYRVWRGSRNPNAVQVYNVKDVEDGNRLARKGEVRVLFAIAEDPGRAAQEFGWRTGSCGRCALPLENNLSRKLGTGPVCMKHTHDRDTRLRLMAEARAELREEGLDPAAKFDSLEAVA
jgi:hypothetical protein